MTDPSSSRRVFINEPSDPTGQSHELLAAAGLQVILGRDRWDQPERPMTEAELVAACQGVAAVSGVSRDRYSRDFMAACPELRLIAKVGVGVDKIDLAAATELGILVTNTPVDEGIKAVAEHAVTLMTALVHTLPHLERVLRTGGWRGPATSPCNLFGKTVGLIGYGRIARAVAQRLQGWEVDLLTYDPFIDAAQAAAGGARLVSLDELLERSHIVSVHVVATADTADLLGAAEFARMRRGAYLINTSRGEVIDEAALAQALACGHLAGAALDVFKQEPPHLNHPLFALPNVIATPHAAGFAAESIHASALAAARNIITALNGEIPANLVNPAAIPRWRQRWGYEPDAAAAVAAAADSSPLRKGQP